MAVARLDTAASFNVDGSTYAVSAGTDRLLMIALQEEGAITEDTISMTWGGQSMTKAVNVWLDAGGNDQQITIFYLLEAGIAAASGSTFSTTNEAAEPTWHASSYTGVDQGGGTSTIPETNDDETAASTPNPLTGADVTAGDDSAVVSVSGSGQATSATWGSDLTEQTDQQDLTAPTTTGSMADGLFATGQVVDAECTWASQNRAVCATIEIAPAATIVREQEGFQFRDDDGSESGATDLGAQDANLTARVVDTNTRLRFLTNYTGDPPAEAGTMQYKRTVDADSEWRDAPLT